jgi:hypothetical protein
MSNITNPAVTRKAQIARLAARTFAPKLSREIAADLNVHTSSNPLKQEIICSR